MKAQDDPSVPNGKPPETQPDPARCLVGSRLCRVRVLSDAEFHALPENEKPAAAEHVDGLGWVVALPEENLN